MKGAQARLRARGVQENRTLDASELLAATMSSASAQCLGVQRALLAEDAAGRAAMRNGDKGALVRKRIPLRPHGLFPLRNPHRLLRINAKRGPNSVGEVGHDEIMETQTAWVAIGVALVEVGMADMNPPPWVACVVVAFGVAVAAIAILGRWFTIIRREHDRH